MYFKVMPAATFGSACFLKVMTISNHIFIHFLKTEILQKSIPLGFRSDLHTSLY